MKRYLLPALLLSVFFLAGRFWSELSVHAGGGGAFAGNGDVNGDGFINITDVIGLLNWMYLGGSPPVACADGGGLTPDQLEALSHITMVNLANGEGGIVRTIRISGVNVQIVNGLGTTNGVADPNGTRVNGLGNLIVGYQELRGDKNYRNGSHNIVVGSLNDYKSVGGLVVGERNTISGRYSSVSGGSENEASGPNSSVSGGGANTASGSGSSVSGGTMNNASGSLSSISGGDSNTAGWLASVSGGSYNTASGPNSSVSGGGSLDPSGGNVAEGDYSSVSGGAWNKAQADYSSISGGYQNVTTEGTLSSVTGGQANIAKGFAASVSGGASNTASRSWSSVSGGMYNTASGRYSSVSGGGSNDPSAGNVAEGDFSSVSGGGGRKAPGPQDWVAGTRFEDN